MSKAQKRVLVIGLLLMAAAALFPPKYHSGGSSRGCLYSSYFFRPESINFMKLLVEWMFLATLTGAGMLMANGIGSMINRSVEKEMQIFGREQANDAIKSVDEE